MGNLANILVSKVEEVFVRNSVVNPLFNNHDINPIRSAGGDITHFIGFQNEVADPADEALWQTAAVGYDRLTGREREVFALLASGHSNKSVAQTLQISPRTVEKHRKAVLGKFDTSNLAVLVRYGIVLGIPFEPPAS